MSSLKITAPDIFKKKYLPFLNQQDAADTAQT